ncbi:MAG TPA: hypothetical protein VF032_17390 [Thermoleophilaceae bacterium]
MPDRRTPRTRAEYPGLFLPSIGAALTCSVLYIALDLSLPAGGALSGGGAVIAAIATCELGHPELTGYRDRDLRVRDLRTSALFVAAWALCATVVVLTHDRDSFDRFVACYFGPPLFLAPGAGFAWAAIRHRTLRAAHGGKNLGSFPAVIVALTMVATAAVSQR